MSNSGIQRSSDDYENLKGSKYGFEKYMTTKYYKNLTQSQFANRSDAQAFETGFRRESLNPAVNLMRLRQRLATTDAIAARYTPVQRDWLRLSLEKVGSKVWKYKFNYMFKFAFLYKLYSEIKHLNYLKRTTVLPGFTEFIHFQQIVMWSAASVVAICLF
uniref:Uncharacterized protein n=1 Tax=Euplotes harpa TaxID=151035 RepID=A0A7S3N9L4_9SPIT|mmetsp:Transcript_26428/g.30555  ORF Transcript_26428/g.30555 Transcript_26428/m.30555 type:complete len:160 (+) Transcript_26428:14-493(+)